MHNACADRCLLDRFRTSGHPNITAMIGTHDVEVPTFNGKPVCLAWALKGTCSTSCKRKDQHANYSRSITQKLHKLMDDCGVENPQP